MPSSSVLYEVVLTISPERRQEFLDWLAPHMREMLGFDGFDAADLLINIENDCEITCHYRVRDMAAMQAYLNGPAKTMRADGLNRFGTDFSATRRILTAQ